MFRYGVSAALETLPMSQPVTLRGEIDTLCRTVKEMGYDALELHLREPGRYDAHEIRRVADSYGLPICATANGMEYTVGGLCLIDEDSARREAAIARLIEHAEFASVLGAKLVVGIMRGNIPGNADRARLVARFEDALGRVCDHAQSIGVPVVLESINRYINNYLCSVPETIDFIVQFHHPNLSLHLDTHSMAVEERDLPASIRYCAGKPVGYVHYSDNNRRYPGGGALDFKAMTHALMDIGYEGYITVECLPDPTPEEAARRGLRYMKAAEAMARIERM